MSSVQTSPEYASRAARLDRILAELLKQTPGVEAAAVVSFDGLPMASALPVGMDEDRVAAMSAALLSLAERASQDLNRGLLSQVYIEGEHGSVFLVSAKDEAVLIAVTASGAKVGMMLYEVKLAASKVGEALQGPVPLPSPLPANLSRGFAAAKPADDAPAAEDVAVEDVAVDEVAHAPSEDERVEDTAVEVLVVEEVAIEDFSVEDFSADGSQSFEPQPEVVAAEHETEQVPEPVGAYGVPDDDTDYADSPLGSPLYDQVAFGHPERPDYFVAVPYSAEPPEQAPAQSWYADQPWQTDAAREPLEHHDYATWDEPAAGGEPAETASEAATESSWTSYAPSATVLPGEPTAWS